MQPTIAKISVPRLFGATARERLFRILDEHRTVPVAWIDGPPGAGKTTLAASYLEERGLAALWYQIDAGDADPATLVHYLTCAANRLRARSGGPLPRMVPEHLHNLPAFGRVFFRALFSELPAGIAVVFDNYQELPEGSATHDLLLSLVRELPPENQVLCLSRTEPPRALVSLVAASDLWRLHWSTLRFTEGEIASVAAARGWGDKRLARQLFDLSGGWVAVVRLMLERSPDTGITEGSLPSESLETAFDYLATLLFAEAAPEIRMVMESVAFLTRVTPSVAVALSGEPAAPEVLDSLFRRHLFTDRHPGPEPVYEFHALVRAFLREQAIKGMSADTCRALRRRSAEAAQRLGDHDCAFALYAELAEWDAAVTLFLRQAPFLLENGRSGTVVAQATAIPESVRDRHPYVWYWLGRAQVPTAPELAEPLLEKALMQFRNAGDRLACVRCLVALLGLGYLAHWALARGEPWVEAFVAFLDSSSADERTDLGPVIAAATGQVLYARPWHPAALELPRVAMAALEAGTVEGSVLGLAASALSVSGAGEFELCERITASAMPYVESPTASPSEAAWFLWSVALLRFIQARYEDALSLIQRAIQVSEDAGLLDQFGEILIYRFMIEFRIGDWTAACATLERGEALSLSGRPMRMALLRIYQARRADWRGNRKEAADLAAASQAAIQQIGTPYFTTIFGLFNAEVLAADHRIETARALLNESRSIIDRSPALETWRGALMLAETFVTFQGDGRSAAIGRLREALCASQTGNRRYFLRYLECCMPPLFTLALEEGIEADFVCEMIRLFRLPPPQAVPDAWPRAVHIRTLGGFEVLVNDESLAFSRKLPKKTLALLKALVAQGGREVPESLLCDSLWGEEEADAGRQALAMTVLRLRKLLGVGDAVMHQGGRVWLDRRLCWVDAWRFEALLSDDAPDGALQRALALYGGEFLPDDENAPWSVMLRERLRGKYVHAVVSHGERLEADNAVLEAIRLYRRGVDADALVEAFHQGLMRCYKRLGRHTEAVAVFRRLRQTLSVVLGVAPSAASEELHRAILAAMPETKPVGDATVVPWPDKSQAEHKRGRPS